MKLDYHEFMNKVADWVFESSGKLCDEYENHPFVRRQMLMVFEHIDEAFKNQHQK